MKSQQQLLSNNKIYFYIKKRSYNMAPLSFDYITMLPDFYKFLSFNQAVIVFNFYYI